MCIHRFNHKVEVERCNTKKFQNWSGLGRGWSDLRVFTYFLGRILEYVAEGLVIPNSVFMILTKDRNFIEDVRKEWKKWEEEKGEVYLPLTFSGNYISYGGLVVFIQQIDCPNCGNKWKDDLKCAFLKVNSFLQKT